MVNRVKELLTLYLRTYILNDIITIMRFIKKIIQGIFYPFYRTYFSVRGVKFVWLSILNFRGRRLLKKHSIALDNIEERIITDLKRDGIAFSSLSEMFSGNDPEFDLVKYTESLKARAETKTVKTFLRQLWDIEPHLDFNNPFLKLILTDRVIKIVNSYMDMFSVFYYFTLNITVPVGEQSQAVSSQRWHRDPEDKKMIKIFIYLNDVDSNSGPFYYIKGTQMGGRFEGIFPQKPPRGVYPGDAEVDKTFNKEDIVECIGKKGAIIFADTGGIHKGGFAKTRERVMFTAGFQSRASAWPIRFTYEDNFQMSVKKYSTNPAVIFALTPTKRNFTQWLFGRFNKIYK